MPKVYAGDIAETAVGVLDRSVAVIDAVQHGARTHAAVVGSHGTATHDRPSARSAPSNPRPGRAHRGMGLPARPETAADRRRRAAGTVSLRAVAHPALERLAEITGESAQLYVRSLEGRVCVDGVESSSELRTFVAGRHGAAHLGGLRGQGVHGMDGGTGPQRARRRGPSAHAGDARRGRLRQPTRDRPADRGWASSAGEREDGVGSVSAPVVGHHEELVAVVSISGPTSRVSRIGARRYAPAVIAAARRDRGLLSA